MTTKVNIKPRLSFSEILRSFEKYLGFENDIKWQSSISIVLYHILAIYWCYHYAFPVKWQSVVYAVVMYIFCGFGVTGGAHRLWTHKAYKATLPLKLLLLFGFSSAGQNSLYQWVRDHRMHHKYSDTDADPHNANRGLFFSHIGWLMMKKNSQVILRGKEVDMSDIEADPVLRFHEKYFGYFKLMLCFIGPTMLGVWLWDETWRCAIAWQCFIRYLCLFHSELTVNSLAHTFGYRPFNKNIIPRENRLVASLTLGEGWHNYHHTFPFDYRASDHLDALNFCTLFLNGFKAIGWAYDLRVATPQMINGIVQRVGDGTPVHYPPSEVEKNLTKNI